MYRFWMKKPRTRRATVLIQAVIFGSLVGLGVAALAVDTGLMFSARQELQSGADSAALAAASQLGAMDNPTGLARQQATDFALNNTVMGKATNLNAQADVTFGHAVLNGEKYEFIAGGSPTDAVRVNLKRDSTVSDGPVSLLFAKTFGMNGADLHASAVAMLVPRDMAMVVDLSGSMNDDSEFRHSKNFPSETTGTRPAVQINLKDIWCALPANKGTAGIHNGANPAAPVSPPVVPVGGENQPGTGTGKPQKVTGNPGLSIEVSGSTAPAGPRWGWMTGWGSEITIGSYNSSSDVGLYYIPKGSTCTNTDVVANLTECGYSSTERNVLTSGSNDTNSTHYHNRIKVLLGLAGWKSNKSGGKYSGTTSGDNILDNNEMMQSIPYPFPQGSWDAYVDYVTKSNSQMASIDSNLRYRYGIKTFVNYLLEDPETETHAGTPQLANTPEMPLQSVKDAVQTLVDEVIALDSDDHLSLELFAQYGSHAVNLTVPSTGHNLTTLLQTIPSTLKTYQSAHVTSLTNIGAGFDQGITELTSVRARAAAAKYIILLTDGKPNVNKNNQSVGNNAASAISWVNDRADYAKSLGFTIFTIGVGADVDHTLLTNAATSQEHYFFADSAPDPTNGNKPKYIKQLKEIFKTIGGKRTVRLIQ